jgi:flagella basal body P-ring formation protein FlgA
VANMRHTLILLMLLLPAGLAAADGESNPDPPTTGQIVQVTLNPSATVRSQDILLRDVATLQAPDLSEDGAARVLDTYVGSASVPGDTRVLTRAQILVRLRGAGFSREEIAFDGADKVEVRREAQVVTGREIRDLAVQAVQEKLPWAPEDVTIEVVREPSDLTVASGALEVRVVESFGYRGFGQGLRSFSTVSVPVEILLDGQQARRLTVPIRVRAYATVAVAAVDIARGDLVSEDMIAMTRLDLSGSSGQMVTEPTELVGKRATRTIRAGQPIATGMVEEPPVVHRGDAVTIVSRLGAVVARSQGEATKDGRIGESIPVRVSHSKKELRAVVVDAGTVEVTP